jgi:putative transposase
LTPSCRRALVPELMQRFGSSQRQALRVVQMSASTYLYRSVARDASGLKLRIREITEIWSMDFVADALFDGRKLRMLTVVDCYTRECLAIDVGQSLKGEDVVASLNAIVAARGLPSTIKTDNGSEFISKVMDKWAYERGVELDFSRPGKPTDNARVESFNGRLRQECLNAHWFLSLDDAQAKIGAWRTYYNETRPHSALDWSTPAEFARGCRQLPAATHNQEPAVSTA